VVAVVETAGPAGAGGTADEQALIEHVKGRLAGYKAPRRVRVVESLGRAPNGKLDYGRHRREAADWAGSPAGGPAGRPAGPPD
jgi:fatty-acyl-CoA synthase